MWIHGFHGWPMNRALVNNELVQIRAAMQLMLGAIERLAAAVELDDEPPRTVVPPARPLSFTDGPVDEDLRAKVLGFAEPGEP